MNKLLRYSFMFLLTLISGWAIAGQMKVALSDEAEKVDVTATYANGTVTLTFADYANGAVEPGSGTIEVWNEVAKVAELTNGDFGEGYNELNYSLSTDLEDGTYTIKIPSGAVKGNKTDSWGAMTALPACEARVEITASNPEAGILGNPTFELLDGAGVNVKYTYPDSQEGMNNKDTKETTAVLYEDGVQVATATFGFQMDPTFFYGVHFDYTTQEGKSYSVVFPAGSWYIYSEDNKGVQTVLEESAEQSYEWTGTAGNENTGDGGNDGDGWKFAAVTPAEGKVESLHDLTFAYPAGIMWVNESATLDIKSGDDTVAQIMMFDNVMGACVGTILDQTLTAAGTYTLVIPAGSFTDGEGNPNATMTYTWTIGGEGDNTNPGGDNTGDLDGKKWQEKIFTQGTAVAIPLNIETEGVVVTSEGREFMGITLDVAYNTYGEGELDWNNGTKLIITAKDNITGIVFEGNFLQFASADKGNYVNGMWTGTLQKGETLTLTANDGIHIHSAVILYNGDELKIEDNEEEDGKINVIWPEQNAVIASIAQGGMLAKFTTNKDYAQVTIQLKNNNEFYASHDLQTRMYDGQKIGEGVAKDIEHAVTTAVPNEKSYQLFKGDSYTLILKGFVNMWDVQTDNYDAIAEVTVVGNGIEHEPLSAVKLVSMTPAGTPLEPGELLLNGGKVTLTFDGAVTSVTAVNARGMEGSTTYKGTKVDAEGKVWEITFGDLSGLASGETESIIFNLNITAKAEDGAVIFDETKDDYRLEAAWTLVESLSEPENTVIDIAVERIVGKGYDAEQVEFDGAAVLAALGASAWSDVTVAPVNPLTGEQVAYDFDGWCDPQGVPAGWNTGNGICLKTPTLKGDVYSMTLCTFPGLDTEVGTVFPAQWAVNYDGKTVILDVKVTLVAVPELTFEVVKTIDVPVYITPGVAYEGGNTAAFNLAEVVEVLGVADASAITAYIYQPDGSFVMNNTDGWRDAEGYAAGWNTSASMVCTKLDVLGANFYDIMAIDNTYAEGSAYTAMWALTAGEKAVVINVNITFGTEPAVELATLTIGEKVIALSETEAIELDTYPAGAVLAINNSDEAIKKISYEIVDQTINEIIKSQGDLTKGEDGIWRAEMPKDYDLAAGHDFSIHVMARNGMSSFTSQMIYEYNFLVKGTANVATYSTVEIASVTPGEDVVLTEAEPVITVAFTEAIQSLNVTAVLGQMSSQAIAAENVTTEDNINWKINVPAWATVDGNIQLNLVAIDKNGNRVTDKKNGVGLPENCYVQYAWASTVGLPTPTLAENGESMITISELTFQYDGIGLNEDGKTATWQNIVILKDGEPVEMTIEESQFEVKGEDAGNALVWTLPTILYKGVYTIKVPAYAFMLGHDQLNWYNGACEFTVTATGEQITSDPEIALNITKTDWSKIGSQNGEVIGTVEVKNIETFDHIEAEIRCQEDPDQYITFANMMTNGGNLTCYAWEGGSYTLNKGYHYTLIINAFDVPYYGAAPVVSTTYEFVGTGAEATKYSDLEMVKVDLPENGLLYHGYDLKVSSFDVTFSAPVSKVKVWGAFGQDGSKDYSATKKSEDGTVWTIVLDEDVLNEEGSINVMVQAWDENGVMAKGWNGDHAFDMNLIISLSDAIKNIEMAYAGKTIYTLNGMRIQAAQMKKGQVYIVNGKKVVLK